MCVAEKGVQKRQAKTSAGQSWLCRGCLAPYLASQQSVATTQVSTWMALPLELSSDSFSWANARTLDASAIIILYKFWNATHVLICRMIIKSLCRREV